MEVERYVIVTRYKHPNGTAIRHVYSGESGNGYSTRSKARTAVKQHIKAAEFHYGETFVAKAIASGQLEVNAVKEILL